MSKLQAQFTKYIKIALKNDSVDYFRMQNRKSKFISISFEEIENFEVLKSFNDDFDTFSFFKNSLMESISDKKLYLGIKSLTSKQQNILSLYIDGESYMEIAEKLNITVGTVKSTMFQIKKKIRKYLGGN